MQIAFEIGAFQDVDFVDFNHTAINSIATNTDQCTKNLHKHSSHAIDQVAMLKQRDKKVVLHMLFNL
jgi:hypothetical protein